MTDHNQPHKNGHGIYLLMFAMLANGTGTNMSVQDKKKRKCISSLKCIFVGQQREFA